MSRCSPCIALVSARSTLLAECSPRSRKRSSRGSLEYETARSGTRRSVKSFSSLGANASRHGLFGNTTSRAHESITSAYKPLRSIFIGESCISVTSPSFEEKSDYDWKTSNSKRLPAHSPSLGGRFACEPMGEAVRSGGGLAGGVPGWVCRTCVRQTSC